MRPETDSQQHSPRIYLGVYLALMILLGVTWGAAYLDLGALNLPIAIGIAALKALLIAIFFMHLKGGKGSKLTRIFAIGALLWLLILFGFTLSDYFTRFWSPGR